MRAFAIAVLVAAEFGCASVARSQPANVSALGLKLGTHTLDDVVARLGNAERVYTGDASTAETSVCYQAGHGEVIVFASNDEMGGRNLELTDIRLHVVGQGDRDCLKLVRDSPISLSNGLRLGLTKAQVRSTIGVCLAIGAHGRCVKVPFRKGTPGYKRWAGAKGCYRDGEAPYYSVCTTVAAKFEGDKAVWIQVTRIESVC